LSPLCLPVALRSFVVSFSRSATDPSNWKSMKYHGEFGKLNKLTRRMLLHGVTSNKVEAVA
jgi:hypothetical protein